MTAPRLSRFPDSLVLIFGLILLAQVATYVLPAGEFERDGRQVVGGTYHTVAAEPLPVFTFLTAVPVGLADAADIIFFILIVGGVFGVLRATGAIDALIGLAINRLGGRPVLLVGGMVSLFALGSSTVGMAEEYMPFVPLLVTMCLALRMDAVVAVGIIQQECSTGFHFWNGVGYGRGTGHPVHDNQVYTRVRQLVDPCHIPFPGSLGPRRPESVGICGIWHCSFHWFFRQHHLAVLQAQVDDHRG